MNDVEELNNKLRHFDNPEKFKKFVLLTYKKNRCWLVQKKYERLLKNYDSPTNRCTKEFHEVIAYYIRWGLLTKNENKEENKAAYIISPKGIKALSWRYIAPQKPDWLTEKGRFWINACISILVLVLSNIAIFKSCN